jgi:hypothetical protein
MANNRIKPVTSALGRKSRHSSGRCPENWILPATGSFGPISTFDEINSKPTFQLLL